MRIVQLLLAGLMALFAMLAVFFAAALVIAGAVAGAVLRVFTGRPRPPRPAASPRPPSRARVIRADDAIDVEAEVVPDDPPR